MRSDADLLRLYAETRSDDAFTELVNRYLGLVYSAALRQVAGDAHRAKDISQLVFTDLAKKADRLSGHPLLSAWLYQSTRYAAANAVRAEIRRKKREKEADAMQKIQETSDAIEWARIGPVIDDVICTLSSGEREAIFLRFFSEHTFAQIGAHYQITADAARFRVERALEKIRHQLARKGVNSTSAALAIVLDAQLCSAAPPGMAATVAAAAAIGTGMSTAISVLSLMATYKQIGIVTALIVAMIPMATLEFSRQRALRHEITDLAERSAALPVLRAENQRLRILRSELNAGRVDSVNAVIANSTPPHSAHSSNSAMALNNSGGQLPAHLEPVLIDRVEPIYPARLLGSGISGSVRVNLVVDRDGSVVSARADTKRSGMFSSNPGDGRGAAPSIPDGGPDLARLELESAAVDAVNQWVFLGGRAKGRSVNTRVQVTIPVEPPVPFIPANR